MNRNKWISSLLASLGVTALVAYIIACGSGPAFSPDDSKVLLVASDPGTDGLGVLVHDRKNGRNDQVFAHCLIGDSGSSDKEQCLLRPMWTPDGRNIVVAWAGAGSHDDELNLAVVPLGGRGPTRILGIGGIKDAAKMPLTVAGSSLFVVADSNRVARVNLASGQSATHYCKGQKVHLYPSFDGSVAYYASESEQADKSEFGKLDPVSFAQTAIMQVAEKDLDPEQCVVAVSRDGKKLALLPREKSNPVLRLVSAPGTERTLPLGLGDEKVAFGNACFSAQGDILYAAFASEQNTNTLSLGFMAIPLDGKPLRRSVLVSDVGPADKDAVLYFQVDLSHDGKTLAACSSIQAMFEKSTLKPQDCALFLVDVSRPEGKVEKIPVPFPRKAKPQ